MLNFATCMILVLVLSTGAPAVQTQEPATSTELEGLTANINPGDGLVAEPWDRSATWDGSVAELWDRSAAVPWDGSAAWDRSAAGPWDGTFNSRSWQGPLPINGPLDEVSANTRRYVGLSTNRRSWDGLSANNRPWDGLSANTGPWYVLYSNTRPWDALSANTRPWEGIPRPWQTAMRQHLQGNIGQVQV